MIHYVKIRFCSQCRSPLPQKCAGCLKHPDREPKVIELYDFPKPLKISECGCCVLLRCQRPGCTTTFWRSTRNNVVKGRSRHATFICGGKCRAIMANAGRQTSVMLSCGYCKKQVKRQPAQIPLNRVVYCNPECWYKWLREQTEEDHKRILKQKAIDAFEARRLARIDRAHALAIDGDALLSCVNGCKTETPHIYLSPTKALCSPCGKVRHISQT